MIIQGFSLKKTMCSYKKTMYSNKKTMCSHKKTMYSNKKTIFWKTNCTMLKLVKRVVFKSEFLKLFDTAEP